MQNIVSSIKMISFKKGFPYFSLNKWCNSEKNIDKKGMIQMKSKHLSEFDESLPHQINAPNLKGTGSKRLPPFVNSFGVTIGDSYYTSKESPLENWSDNVDPAVMSGSEWVHPTNDIGWNTPENKELIENKLLPQTNPYMHPTKNVSKAPD